MSKIPDYTALRREIPQVSGDIDTRGVGAAGDLGLKDLSSGLMKVAGATSEAYQRRANNEFAKAKADMEVALISESNAFDDDPDYGTHVENFTTNIEQKKGEIGARITNSSLREKFNQYYKPRIASNAEKVRGAAWGKEQEFERGELNTRLDTLRDAAILSGDLGDAHNAAAELIQTHTDIGHIKADYAADLKMKFKDSLSKGYLIAQEPEKRVELLKQKKVRDNLSPDDYAVLKREAEASLRIGKAQDAVDGYLDEGLNRGQAMEDIDKRYSDDPKLRKEVESRFDYAFAKQEKAEVEMQSELFDKYFLSVRAGESMVADIPRHELEAMSPPQQNSLFSAQSTSVSKTKVGFNVEAEDRLNALYQTKKYQELRQYFIENAGSMSDSQNKSWSKVSIEGVVPPDVKSLFSANASIDAKTPNYTKERRAPLKDAMNDWYQSYQESTGQVPTDDVVNKQVDRMIMEYDTSWWWGGTKPLFEMSEDEKTSMLEEAQEEDAETFDDVTEYFKGLGIQPDHAQFMEGYTILRDKRAR